MVINYELANKFIMIYKQFLLSLADEKFNNNNVLSIMSKCINKYKANKELFQEYIIKNKIDDSIIESIKNIEYKKMVYIKTIKKYSIFYDYNIEELYGVFGLLDEIDKVVPCTFSFIECGLTRIGNKYIYDGLITNVVIIGNNMKFDINEKYKKIKFEKGINE